MTTFVSPTEPRPLVAALGRTHSLPERHGVDILWTSPYWGFVGCQRKELNDLLASIQDGRLSKELAQINNVGLPILIVEGQPQWTLDGELMNSRRQWSRSQHRNLLMSVQAKGVLVQQTVDLADTIEAVLDIRAWSLKHRHNSLDRRPKARGIWGVAGHRDFGCHVLQSFAGVGPVQAQAIYDHFGGVPLRWTVAEEEMRAVKGVGVIRAKRMMEALGGK